MLRKRYQSGKRNHIILGLQIKNRKTYAKQNPLKYLLKNTIYANIKQLTVLEVFTTDS